MPDNIVIPLDDLTDDQREQLTAMLDGYGLNSKANDVRTPTSLERLSNGIDSSTPDCIDTDIVKRDSNADKVVVVTAKPNTRIVPEALEDMTENLKHYNASMHAIKTLPFRYREANRVVLVAKPHSDPR